MSSALVDDLLDVSRITRGQVQLKRERVDIADVVAKAVEMTEAMVSAKRQHTAGRCAGWPGRQRRCGAAGPGDDQPADQCEQVHRRRGPDRHPGRHRRRSRSKSSCAIPAVASRPRRCRWSSTCLRRNARRSIAAKAASVSDWRSCAASCRRMAAAFMRRAPARARARNSGYAWLRRTCWRRRHGSRIRSSASPAGSFRLRVLVVDDNRGCCRSAG